MGTRTPNATLRNEKCPPLLPGALRQLERAVSWLGRSSVLNRDHQVKRRDALVQPLKDGNRAAVDLREQVGNSLAVDLEQFFEELGPEISERSYLL